jgi:hypothetical protein
VADPDGEAVDSPAGIQRLGAVAEDRGAGCGDGDLVDEQARPDQAASVVYRNRSSIVWPWYADRSGVAADVAVARETVRPAIPGLVVPDLHCLPRTGAIQICTVRRL